MNQTALVAAALAALSLSAPALTLPVSEDTSTTTSVKVAKASGKATTLPVTATRSALVRFEVSALAGTITSSEVSNARLVLYFSGAKVPGDLGVAAVTSAWSEVFTAPLVTPTVGASFATIPTANVVAKQFVIVDVTAQVKGWLDHPATDFGIAVTASGRTSVLLGAKEGSGTGYPAMLEIDYADPLNNGSVTGAQLAPNLTLAGTTTGTFVGDGSGLTNLNISNTLADGSVSNAKLANPSVTITAGSGLAGGGAVALGGQVTVSLGENLILAGTTTGTFSGDGSALTVGGQGLADAFVSKAGASMTGGLTLPADGLTIGSTQLVTTGGRVGIGTSTPTVALHVQTDAAAAGVARFDNKNNQGFAGNYFLQDGVLKGFVGHVNAGPGQPFGGPGLMQLGAATDIVFSATPTGLFIERMRIRKDNGNVGIGKTDPGEKLDVAGNVRADAFIGNGSGITNLSGANLAAGSVGGGQIADGGIGNSQLAANLTLGGTTTGVFSGDGSALTALNAANIGLGTLADGRLSANVPRLDSAATGFAGRLAVGASVPGALNLLQINSPMAGRDHLRLTGSDFAGSDTDFNNGVSFRLGENSPQFRFLWLANSTAAVNNTTAQLQFELGSTLSYAAIASRSTDGTVPTGLVLNPAGGNVGIGTPAPRARLHVHSGIMVGGVTAPAFTSMDSTLYVGSPLKYLGTTLGSSFGNNADWLHLMAHPGSSGLILGFSGNSETEPHAVQTPMFVITPAGPAALGRNTLPQEGLALTVRGSDSQNLDAGLLLFEDLGGTGRWKLTLRNGGHLDFGEHNTSDNRLFLRAGGNVGINTNDPRARLHVKADAVNGAVAWLDNESSGGFSGVYFTEGGVRHGFVGHVNSSSALLLPGVMQLGSTGTDIGLVIGQNERMRIAATGNIGISTATPGARLHIKAHAANDRDNGIRLEHAGNSSRWNIHTEEAFNNLTFSFNDQFGGGNYCYLNSAQAGLISVSDRSTKKDITSLSGVLERVARLRPVSFRYKNAAEGTPPNYGFIAQEVEEVFPDIVLENGGLKTLAGNSLTALNTRAIQELNARLHTALEALREENQALKTRLERESAEKTAAVAALTKRAAEMEASFEARLARLERASRADESQERSSSYRATAASARALGR